MGSAAGRSDALVLGGGLIGLAVAFRLAQHGRSVTLLEAGRLLGGASLATYSWVNANGKQPRPYFDLNRAGMQEHLALVDELGGGEWLHRGGDIQWAGAAGSDALRAKVERMREWGYGAEWIDLATLADLEPDLAPAEDALIAHFPDDFWVDPVVLGARMAAAARAAGAVIRPQAPVAGLDIQGGRVSSVRTSRGDVYEADVIVSCVGPESDQIAELAGAALPMKNTRGLLILSEPAPASISHLVHAPGVYFRPDGAGRLMLAADGLDKQLKVNGGTLEPMEGAERVMALARGIIPSLAGVSAEAARIGTRALTADGHPALGYMPGTDNLYMAVTHSGITLAPLVGRLVAEEVTGGTAEHDLSPYRPDRFDTPVATSPAG
jgi:glycine/D-amino acid oxidase-like deaminating enzyme